MDSLKRMTKTKCHKAALKFKTRNEFSRQNHDEYMNALKNGWLNEVCSHMKRPKQSNRVFWPVKTKYL